MGYELNRHLDGCFTQRILAVIEWTLPCIWPSGKTCCPLYHTEFPNSCDSRENGDAEIQGWLVLDDNVLSQNKSFAVPRKMNTFNLNLCYNFNNPIQ